MSLTLPRFSIYIALVLLLPFIFLLLFFPSIALNIENFIDKHISAATSPIIALSVSLVIFPIITIPFIANIITIAKDKGIKVTKELVEDYINGCYTVFTLAIIELLLIFIKPFLSNNGIISYIIISILIVLIITLAVLMLSLWQATKLLYGIVAIQEK